MLTQVLKYQIFFKIIIQYYKQINKVTKMCIFCQAKFNSIQIFYFPHRPFNKYFLQFFSVLPGFALHSDIFPYPNGILCPLLLVSFTSTLVFFSIIQIQVHTYFVLREDNAFAVDRTHSTIVTIIAKLEVNIGSNKMQVPRQLVIMPNSQDF